MRIVDDYPTDLTPINEVRKCSACQAWTWWAGPKQRTLGRCWECVPGLLTATLTPEHEQRVLDLLLTAFPGTTVAEARVRRYRPDTYAGPDAGPCRGCGRRVRLYGIEGHPFCLTCRPRDLT